MSSSISVKYPGLQNWSFCQLYGICFIYLTGFTCFLQTHYSLFYALKTNIRSATQRILINCFKENEEQFQANNADRIGVSLL